MSHTWEDSAEILVRTVGDLRLTGYVEEWLGPRRLPVFDARVLAEYGDDRANRQRLVRLLASFVHGSSGSVWRRRSGRWLRRRWSLLNLLDLAGLGSIDRLGDLACSSQVSSRSTSPPIRWSRALSSR